MATVYDPVPEDEFVLYHAWPSSASRRVRFCLEEKGIPYTGVLVSLTDLEQHSPAYLKLNPNGVVPTLVHQGKLVIESTVINEYIDTVRPEPPLRPSDPHEAARMRIWTKYTDEVVIRAFQVITWNRIMHPVARVWNDEQMKEHLQHIPMPERREDWRRMARRPFTEEERELAVTSLRHMLKKMEQALADGPWLAGAAFSLADVNMTPYAVRFHELEEHGVSLGCYPATAAWFERIRARPAMARARIEPMTFAASEDQQ